MSGKDDFDDDLEPAPRSGGGGSVILALALGFGGLVVGLAIGGGLGWSMKPAKEHIVEVPRNYTAEELEEACAPMIKETADELEVAQSKVDSLTTQVTSKETEVAELEAEMSRRAKKGVELVNQLELARRELESLRAELEVAREEKRQLVIALDQKQAELDEQIIETELAQEDALTHKWLAFQQDAQLEICEKGNRKQLGRCRETVDAKLDASMRERFRACVSAGQAMPQIREAEKKEALPEFGQYIDEEDRITKGWYILFCDPTLPQMMSDENQGVPRQLPAFDEDADLEEP